MVSKKKEDLFNNKYAAIFVANDGQLVVESTNVDSLDKLNKIISDPDSYEYSGDTCYICKLIPIKKGSLGLKIEDLK